MSIVKNWGVILVIAAAMTGCGQEHNHKGKTPLVEVSGEFLYKEDLQAALPLNISKDDSVLFAEHYIRNWIEDALLFDKAEGNIPDNDKISKLAESLSPCIDYAHLCRGVGESEIGKRYQ